MKFIIQSSSLQKNIQGLSGVLNTSNTMDILDNFLFDITNGQLTISASDLETTMTASMSVESKENIRVAIPAKLLLDIIKSFPDHPLTFTVDEKNYGVEISSDYGKYKLAGNNPDEFPKYLQVENPSEFTMNGDALSMAIHKTLFAAGNDEMRPVMNGVFVQLSKDNAAFVATDAHKLVRYRRKDAKTENEASFILPRKPLNLLKSLLINVEEPVTIQFNERYTRIAFNNFTLTSRLVEGKYPNYEAVIPKENPKKMVIGRQQFLSSLKRVSIFSNKTTRQVRLKINGSELQVSAQDLDFSNEAVERLTCQYDGEEMEIGFNSKFLIEMLNNLDSEEVLLEMSAPNRAGLLTPAEKETPEEEVLMLVMPIMLNN